MFADRHAGWFDPSDHTTPPDPAHDALQQTAMQSEHLLKVAAAVTKDASKVWADLWAEFRTHLTPGGLVTPDMAHGFVPSCGWDEFLEKFWLLKHHLDSASRLCKRE